MEYASVLLDHPEGHTADGAMFVLPDGLVWQQVPFLAPASCDHVEAMCRECIEAWGIDHEIQLPTIQYVI